MQLGPVDCLFIRTLQPSLHPNPIKSTVKSWHSTQEPVVDKVKSRTHYKKKCITLFLRQGCLMQVFHSEVAKLHSGEGLRRWLGWCKFTDLIFYIENQRLLQRLSFNHASPSLEVQASRLSLKARIIHLVQWKPLKYLKTHLQDQDRFIVRKETFFIMKIRTPDMNILSHQFNWQANG